MRTFITIVIFFSVSGLFGQNVESLLGNDDNPILNENEVQLLNSLLSKTRNDFDFKNKKVAFITGGNGITIVSKSDYFKNSVTPWIEKGSEPQIFMVKLTEIEKNESNGYDAIVLSWVKVFTKKSKEKAIKYLRNKK